MSKHGLEIYDSTGRVLLEVGPHVIMDRPAIAQKIGVIAAEWSQAEVNLHCLFGVLMTTTPEIAAKELKKRNTAAKATSAVRKVAAEKLEGPELEAINESLDRLDKARTSRNRVQHDIWAWSYSDSEKIFAIHADEYIELVSKLIAPKNEGSVQECIDLAMKFATGVTSGYSVDDLEKISMEIDSVNKLLLEAMFYRLQQQRTHA